MTLADAFHPNRSLIAAATTNARPALVFAQTGAAAANVACAPSTHSNGSATPVIVTVPVPKPWCARRSLVLGEVRDTRVPYERLPGLLRKHFTLSDTGFANANAATLGNRDDAAMTTASTRQLLAAAPNAPHTVRVIVPVDVGMARIGHLGAFQAPGETALWPLLEQLLHA